MSWWGKIIGGFFGFKLAGPFGLLIGLIIGNIFDQGVARQAKNPFNTHDQHEKQAAFFKATFSIMGHVAKADGRISEDEILVAKQIMQRMRLSAVQKKQAVAFFNQGKQTAFDLQTALDDLKRSCARQRVLLQMFVEIQFQAAMADGLASPKKKQILKTICSQLGFSSIFNRYTGGAYAGGGQSYQRQYAPQRRDSLKDAYALLEIAANVSDKDVKTAYRKRMSQNHPDKLIAQGLPEEMIKLATDKTQKIQAAYETVREARGLS